MATPGDETEISIGYGPAYAKAKGPAFDMRLALLVALLLTIIAVGFFFVWTEVRQHDRAEVELSKQYLANHKLTQDLLTQVINNQAKIISEIAFSNKEIKTAVEESGASTAYVLTLTQSQREALKLEMPRLIRERVRPPKRRQDD